MGKMGLAPPVKTPDEIITPAKTPQETTKTEKTTNKSSTMSSNTSDNSTQQITVPDIGTDQAKVVEIFVNIGDTIAKEDPILMLESDKASMELPSTHAGVVSAISVEIDQDISEGMPVVELTVEGANSQSADTTEAPVAPAEPATVADNSEDKSPAEEAVSGTPEQIKVAIPDIGGDSAKVIEILVNVGDQVAKEDPLVTLESDKASMDVPSSADGVIESIDVEMDQDVGEGTVVVTLMSASTGATAKATADAPADAAVKEQTPPETSAAVAPVQAPSQAPQADTSAAAVSSSSSKSHASPSIRRFARELGADLSKINGSGRKGRISKDDVKAFVKSILSGKTSSAAGSEGTGIPQVPAQDFSKFGDIDIQPLNRIKRLTATNLHRSWLNVPHVTHSDESDITDLESFRKQLNAENAKQENGVKLSPLAFIVKAVVRGLQTYPQFNSSLEPGGENLIYKKYFHIGIAVETPNGLVVPVIRDADQKSVGQIATEMGELAAKARDKKLTMADMSGACITISSLGGIGGTHFTPIVNAPEVAILGVSRSKVQPQWNGTEFVPATMLPLSLSYDHRVIDGAEAARFTRHIAAVLEDVRRLTI